MFARGPEACSLAHKDVATAWETALRSSGLPLALSDAAHQRPRISFAAPAPVGMLAERELVDIALTERRRRDEVRDALVRVLPPGHALVDLYDVWVGETALGAAVVAADYRVQVSGPGRAQIDEAALGAAVDAVLGERDLECGREKGTGVVIVNVRPLLLDLRTVSPAGGGSIGLWMRLRLGGESRGGRPEEVVTILGERIGCALIAVQIVRERIVLADERA